MRFYVTNCLYSVVGWHKPCIVQSIYIYGVPKPVFLLVFFAADPLLVFEEVGSLSILILSDSNFTLDS